MVADGQSVDPLDCFLALDFGGTKLSAAVVSGEAGEWESQRRTESGTQAYECLESILNLSHELLKGRKPAAIGVSFGGPVIVETGHVVRSFQVAGWEDFPLQSKLQSEFKAPVIIDNDANAAALGEARFGAGRDCKNLFYITVSTGIGGGWILDGHLFRGANDLAGEIGHLIVDPNGPRCGCGRYGCLETIASGTGIARYARERLTAESFIGNDLRELVNGDLSKITAEHVARAAESGDGFSADVMDRAAAALGKGIGTAITLMNPQRVIVGGGVAKSGQKYWQSLRETVLHNVLPGMEMDVVPAALKDDSPLWGAIALAKGLI